MFFRSFKRLLKVFGCFIQNQLSSFLLSKFGFFTHQKLVAVFQHITGFNFSPDNFTSEFIVALISAILDQRIPLEFDIGNFVVYFGLSEGPVEFLDNVLQVEMNVRFRVNNFKFVCFEVIVRIFIMVFKLVDSVEQHFIKLKKVLLLFSVIGLFLLVEILFILCDILVYLTFPFLFYIPQVIFFRGSCWNFLYFYFLDNFDYFFQRILLLALFLVKLLEDGFLVNLFIFIGDLNVFS